MRLVWFGVGLRALMGVLVAAGFFNAAHAADAPSRGLAIARANACMGCHAVDRKLVGPSFQQIAEKYKGNAGAGALLSKKVKDGGSGVEGATNSGRTVDSERGTGGIGEVNTTKGVKQARDSR